MRATYKKCLIDTHIFIGWMEGRLGKNLKQILENPQNIIYLSHVSIWEILIKKKSGRLKIPRNWKEDIKNSHFEVLPIKLEHIFGLENLPLYHKDPFDRLLIAQSKIENLTLITADPKMAKYKISMIKN